MAAPTEVSETAAPRLEGRSPGGGSPEHRPRRGERNCRPRGGGLFPRRGQPRETAPAEVGETAAPGAEAVPQQGAPQQGAPWGWPGPWGWQAGRRLPCKGCLRPRAGPPGLASRPTRARATPPYQAQPWNGQQPGPYVPPGPWGPGPYAVPQSVPASGRTAPGRAAPGPWGRPREDARSPGEEKAPPGAEGLPVGGLCGWRRGPFWASPCTWGTAPPRAQGCSERTACRELPYESSSPYEDMPYEEDDPLPQEDMPYEEGEEEEQLASPARRGREPPTTKGCSSRASPRGTPCPPRRSTTRCPSPR